MQLAVIEALAVGLLLTCLVESLSGSPQRPYWTLPEVGSAANHQEFGNRFPLQINHGSDYRGSLNSPYESIDQFQLEQRNQPEYQSRYNYDDEYSNRYRNGQESYYQSLLRVTENPLREVQNHETYAAEQEAQTYYQDYLPLDDNESFNMEQYDPKKTNGEVNPAKTLSGINEKVENSTEQKISALMTKLLTKDATYVPSLNDLDALNSLEDEMIAEASVPDEIKRGIRQVRGQRPGVLWTLARLAFEKVNETKSAINQIGTIVNSNFVPEEEPSSPNPTTSTTTTTISSSDVDSNDATTAPPTTTTEVPFRLTRTNLRGIIRRNLKGLIRLFNIEWRDALNQSQVSVREFQRDLGNQIRPYLDENPNVSL